MASFPICPLIDQRCFLGVSDDVTPGCIIVSLGKKIIIRFRLSDQKQLSSWTTKDKLSTPVFYDADREEYFAVFNGCLISRWPKDRKSIHKKTVKYKFPWVVDSIHCNSGMRPVILFKSGTLAYLCTENKKSITIIRENVVTLDDVIQKLAFSFSSRYYLCFLVKGENKLTLEFVPISESDEGAFSIDAVRKGCDSSLCCFTVIQEKGYLITLWSDGCLYLYGLNQKSQNVEDFPGRCVTTFTNINCTLPCVMLAIDDHVAIYGADSNGEGAKIIWVDASFGVIQNSLHLKLYSSPPRMWKVGNSYLITLVGQNLTVIPYQLKSVPKLDSLLAAHCPTESNVTQVSWEHISKSPTHASDKDCSEISQKIKDGFPEYLLSREFVAKLLENGKVKEALTHMNNLTDIPDKCIVDTVVSCLNLKNERSRTDLLLKALSFPLLDDSETLSYIRDRLPFESAVSLLSTISDQLEKDPENSCLIKWLSLLLDSHYQQYLLIKDEAIVSKLSSLKQQIDTFVSNMVEFQELYKLLSGTLKTKVSSKSVVQYSVDKFSLY